MIIYLMRHGEASFDAHSDHLRELTQNGRDKIKYNVEQKINELSQVKRFLSSPIVRAQQTAELSREIMGRVDQITFVDWLIHESNPKKSIMQLSEYKEESVMLFTHQPFASRFVEILCNLNLGEIGMNPASIVAMEADPVAEDFGKILWQLH